MYDENNMNGLNNSSNNPEDRTPEPDNTIETNFTMRDPEPPEQRRESYDSFRQKQDNFRGQEYYQDNYRTKAIYNNIPEEPKHDKKKKGKAAGRIAGVTAAALLFGTVAGGTMFGVNYLGEQFIRETYPQVSQATTPTENATAMPPNSNQAVTAISTDVSTIVERAMPSVVAITNTMLYQSNSFFGQSQTYEIPSSGSGIVINQNDSELLIVTNNHVVEGSTSLKVTFIDNTTVDAAIKGTDPESDLAVIAVPLSNITDETFSQITIAKMGNSDELKVGQGVIAIGNALGYGQSVTVGYVSALNREVKTPEQTTHDLLQTDAAINPGNSGGALLNMQGEVIGINAAKYSSTEVEGMGYAIPISKAQEIIGGLMVQKTKIAVDEKDQGYLGIQGQNIDQTMIDVLGMPKGVYVFKIVEGDAASNSDLREKDIITKFDGNTIRSMAELQEILTYYESGSNIALTVQSLENGQYVERQVEVTLGSRPTTAQ